MTRFLAALVLGWTACAAPDAATRARAPADPPPVDEWHAEPVLGRAVGEHVVVLDHAGTGLRLDTIVAIGDELHAWMREYVGVAPPWIRVHVGARYPCGFSTNVDGVPEVFLRAGGIFDTQADWAHEMQHAFASQFGRLPHWFDESLSDVVYADAEIDLYARRTPAFLDSFDRVDHRSYELMQLRRRFGADYFRKVYAAMRARQAEFQRTMRPEVDLEDKNRLILAVLSAAAGEDLEPLFTREFGFRASTRERQRGY